MKRIMRLTKLIQLIVLTAPSVASAQQFVLKNTYGSFTTDDGKGYIETVIYDTSRNNDNYIASIYSVLSNNFPQAKLSVIGNRIVRMENAISRGTTINANGLSVFIDFSVVIEVKEHGDEYNGSYRGVEPVFRVNVPSINTAEVYNPYYHPEFKQTIVGQSNLKELLLSSKIGGGQIADDFFSEINIYLIMAIEEELNHKYYLKKAKEAKDPKTRQTYEYLSVKRNRR